MYGFQLIVNGKKHHNFNNILCSDNLECRNYMIHKFEQDKCFKDEGDILVILDGVIINRDELQQKYPAQDWSSSIRQMYYTLGERFFNHFRGSFAGAIYDKIKKKLIIYTDQLGSKFIYYCQINKRLYVSQMGGVNYMIY